jgi:hypothetical protein
VNFESVYTRKGSRKKDKKLKKLKKRRIFLNEVLEIASSGCLFVSLLLLELGPKEEKKGRRGMFPQAIQKILKVAERGRHGLKSFF